jgi:RNA polymerase sigma factor (sigma-70 family)
MVYRVCLRMLRHHQEAEDATQAVFLVLLNKASRLTRKGELTGWLYGVARNVCLEALRKRARRQEEAMLDETEEPAVEEYRPAHEEVMPFLDEELAGLTGVLRQAVVLRYLQGYSQAEAARQANCTEVTLSVRASRGIERLRQRLTKRGVALGGVALVGLLTSEASAAVPETLLPSILATVKTAAATTATATGATTTAAMLAKGAMKAMFIAKVKMVAAVAAAVIVTGTAVPVGIAVAQSAKAATSHMPVNMKDEGAASTKKVVRLIRLKYDGPGWDDGLDESGADRNFLERFGQLTGLKVSKNGDAHTIELLAKYPKGFAPAFVFITGTGEIIASDEEVQVLQAYLAGGGMLWADCGGAKWDTSFRALMMRVFPDEPLRDIPDEDPIFRAPFKFPNGAPPLWQHGGKRALGIKLQDRWAVFYHPGDMNDAWKTGHAGLSEAAAQPAFELGVNIVSYARKAHLDAGQQTTR